MKRIARPNGLFEGTNFMTPTVKGYYKLRTGYAELSTGEGLHRQPIFGVTIRPDEAGQSKLFQSLTGATDYIEELS